MSLKYDLNHRDPTARDARLGDLLFTRTLGPTGVQFGTDANQFALGPFDFMIDGLPHYFPGADNIALPGASTTSTQYRKILLTITSSAGIDKFQNHVIGGDFAITAAGATTLTGAGHVRYTINGVEYYTALDTTIDLTGTDVLDANMWRAYRIEINSAGTVSAISDGDSQHVEEDTALIGLGTIAPDPDKCTIAYFTIDSNGGFTPGSHNVNGETAEYIYHVRGYPDVISRRWTKPASTDVALDAGATTFDVAALDVLTLGQKQAQLAAQSDVAGDADGADLISTLKYGAWVLCYVKHSGTNDTYLLSAKGQELDDGASTQAYATAALALAAANTQIAQLPEVVVPIAIITVHNGTDGNFTIGTTEWDATSVTSAVTLLYPYQYYVTATAGAVSTVSQAAAKLPKVPNSSGDVPVGVLELGNSFTNDTTDLTAAMCKEMDLRDYGECMGLNAI